MAEILVKKIQPCIPRESDIDTDSWRPVLKEDIVKRSSGYCRLRVQRDEALIVASEVAKLRMRDIVFKGSEARSIHPSRMSQTALDVDMRSTAFFSMSRHSLLMEGLCLWQYERKSKKNTRPVGHSARVHVYVRVNSTNALQWLVLRTPSYKFKDNLFTFRISRFAKPTKNDFANRLRDCMQGYLHHF